MLRSANQLRTFWVRSIEDIVGTVDDFLFHETLWRVRFLVVDTGGWLRHRRKTGRRLADRQVMIPPSAVSNSADTDLSVVLTTEQFRNGPDAPIHSTDPQMRSLKEILGYPLLGRDGEIGRVEDALLDMDSWEISDLAIRLVDNRTRRTVLIPASAIRGVDRGAAIFFSELTRPQVEGSASVATRQY